MISQELLDILRCPLNPSQSRLLLEDDQLVCERCRLRFKIKGGFPVLIPDTIDSFQTRRQEGAEHGPDSSKRHHRGLAARRHPRDARDRPRYHAGECVTRFCQGI